MNTLTRLEEDIEEIISSLHQADALLTVLTYSNFFDLPPSTIMHHLWVTSNIIHNAKQHCEKLHKVKNHSIYKNR